jgi:hypothetical protein
MYIRLGIMPTAPNKPMNPAPLRGPLAHCVRSARVIGKPLGTPMTLDDLIAVAASNRALARADVERVARQMGLPLPGLMDEFARVVATRYLRGEYSYEFGDMAMNQLFGFAYPETDLGLTEFAWQVFDAFDEGEYNHTVESLELQGEPRTRELLSRIRALDGA